MAKDDENSTRDADSAAHNPPSEDDNIERRIADQPGVAPAKWVQRAVLVLVGVIVVFVAAAFLPRWWARQIKDLSQGEMTPAVLWGLGIGLVFALIPLLVLFQARRGSVRWKYKAFLAAGALVLASPNWLTLWIAVGGSDAAHDASRILSDNAPGFRWASLIGAALGAVGAVALTSMSMRMKHRKNEVKRLRGERDDLRSRDARTDQE